MGPPEKRSESTCARPRVGLQSLYEQQRSLGPVDHFTPQEGRRPVPRSEPGPDHGLARSPAPGSQRQEAGRLVRMQILQTRRERSMNFQTLADLARIQDETGLILHVMRRPVGAMTAI